MDEYRCSRVANVDAAIELAAEFKQSGKFDWFRGQTQPWPPHGSSFRRHGDPDWKEQCSERFKKFYRWAAQTPGLEAITAQRDAVFAVAQHYGIPTNYIDFTTDPGIAGFFACDTKEPQYGKDSCIYCLDTEHLRRNWPKLKRAYRSCADVELPDVEIVVIDVPNLWRLQAQRGTFLYMPLAWDQVYPLYKILFPYTGYPALPVKDEVYPDRKSKLEIVLDQYFTQEKDQEKGRKFFELLQAWDSPNKVITETNSREEGYFAKSFIGGALPPLESWDKALISDWLILTPELYQDMQTVSVRLAVDPELPTTEMKGRISSGVMRLLKDRPDIRRHSINLVLQDSRHPEKSFAPDLIVVLHRLWDGIRALPYSNAEVAESIAACITLNHAGLALHANEEASKRAARDVFGGEVMVVEFGSDDRSYSRAVARVDQLTRALRKDVLDLLIPDHRDWYGGRMDRLFQLVQSPRRIFEFASLADIFAKEIIPSQVLLRESPMFFSPARVDRFGNP